MSFSRNFLKSFLASYGEERLAVVRRTLEAADEYRSRALSGLVASLIYEQHQEVVHEGRGKAHLVSGMNLRWEKAS